jgi:hypothetical protein
MLRNKLGYKIKNVRNSVGIAKGYGLDGRCSSPVKAKSYSLFHSIQTTPWGHLASNAMSTGASSSLG